jgi:hypothetical protein
VNLDEIVMWKRRGYYCGKVEFINRRWKTTSGATCAIRRR